MTINDRNVAHLSDVFDENGDVLTRKVRVPFRYRWKTALRTWIANVLEAIMYLIVLLGAALMLLACSNEPGFSRPVLGSLMRQCVSPTIVYCDPSLDSRACSAVQVAIDWWATQVPGRALLLWGGVRAVPQMAHGETLPMNEMYVGKAPDSSVPKMGEDTQAAATQYHAFQDTMCRHDVLIVQHLDSDYLADGSLVQMFKHEFGHVLGLPHAVAPGCLMAPSGSGTLEHSQVELCESERNLINALYERD